MADANHDSVRITRALDQDICLLKAQLRDEILPRLGEQVQRLDRMNKMKLDGLAVDALIEQKLEDLPGLDGQLRERPQIVEGVSYALKSQIVEIKTDIEELADAVSVVKGETASMATTIPQAVEVAVSASKQIEHDLR